MLLANQLRIESAQALNLRAVSPPGEDLIRNFLKPAVAEGKLEVTVTADTIRRSLLPLEEQNSLASYSNALITLKNQGFMVYERPDGKLSIRW